MATKNSIVISFADEDSDGMYLLREMKPHLPKIVKIQAAFRRYVVRKKIGLATSEFVKIFNSIEFDLKIHSMMRVPEKLPLNILKQPKISKYVPKRSTNNNYDASVSQPERQPVSK